jgi:hypothetical protein
MKAIAEKRSPLIFTECTIHLEILAKKKLQGKTMVQIYNYVDYQIPKFYRMFRKRQAGYKRNYPTL